MTEVKLFCNKCGAELFADVPASPPPGTVYAIDFSQTAYECGECGYMGAPQVQEIAPVRRTGKDDD